jgi:hypothetical protein
MSPPSSLADLGYIDDAQLSKMLRVTPATLRNWRCAGKGPPFATVHGRHIAYPVDAVRRWLAQRTVTPGATATLATGTPRRKRA